MSYGGAIVSEALRRRRKAHRALFFSASFSEPRSPIEPSLNETFRSEDESKQAHLIRRDENIWPVRAVFVHFVQLIRGAICLSSSPRMNSSFITGVRILLLPAAMQYEIAVCKKDPFRHSPSPLDLSELYNPS